MKITITISIIFLCIVQGYSQEIPNIDSLRVEYFNSKSTTGIITVAASTVSVLTYIAVSDFPEEEGKLKADEFFEGMGVGLTSFILIDWIIKPIHRRRVCKKLGIPVALAKKWDKEARDGLPYSRS